ncbi:MAG: GNAT family N-acetyltransferase [Rhodovibrionaceae bacterium]
MSGQGLPSGRLRRAEAGDAPRLAALHARCFPEEPWTAASFRSLLAMPGALGAVVETEDALDGLILLRRAADEVEVIALAVAPASRRCGLGRCLLDRALARAAEDGARRAFLEVAEDNAAARGLYAAAGFQLCGRRQAYYTRRGGARCDALVLAAPLP